MKNLKILQIITLGDLFYGAQKHVLDLSQALTKQGHEVLIVVGSVGDFTRILDERDVSYRHVPQIVHPIKPAKDLQAVYALRKLIKEFQPDLVATHSAKAGIVGRIAAWLARVPSTFTAHGWAFADGIPETQRNIALKAERFCGKLASRVIAVAEIERDFGLKHKATSPEKLVTIHYGVDDISEGQSRRSLHDEKRIAVPILTMVAGFREQKDHRTLIKAITALKHLPWSLVLLGDGPLRPEITGLVEQAGLSDRVDFKGAVDDVPSYLRQSTILVLATNWEGLPISTIEGLSIGLPVVATNVAGTREQVIDDYNGITVPRGDALTLTAALSKLILDPELRFSFGCNSRKLYEEKFTLDKMIERTSALYEEVVLSQ